MKRIICLIIVIAITVLFCSCGLKTETLKDPVIFYYRNTKTEFGTQAELIVENRRDVKGHAQDFAYLIDLYLKGPTTYDCVSPFPAGTTMEDFSINGTEAHIVLTPHIATLSGSELMVACACLTKTVLEMTGVESVQIRSSNGKLNGKESITLTADSFAHWEG